MIDRYTIAAHGAKVPTHPRLPEEAGLSAADPEGIRRKGYSVLLRSS